MHRFFKFLYSAYALVFFALLLLIALIPYAAIRIFAPYRHQIRWVYRVNRVIMLIWSPLVGMRYDIRGADKIDKEAAYIVIVNHYSLMDMFAAARGLNVAGKPLIKKELLHVPILGWLFRMSAIAVNRSDKESRRRSFHRMEAELKQGISLLIFPEGTRNTTGRPLADFYNGAFHLSVRTGIPILPVVLTGYRSWSQPNSLLFRPGTVGMHYLTPVDPAVYAGDEEALKQACHALMETVILQFDGDFQTNQAF